MAKAFKVHNMYSKTGIKKIANTMAQHNALKKKGYGHKAPAKKVSPLKKTTRAEKNSPSKKKSAGNYAVVKKGGGTGKKAGGGMTAKGVATYRKNNPGSKLKTAVTGKPKAGSKDAGRRKSFCARSRSWKSERGLAARRKWNC